MSGVKAAALRVGTATARIAAVSWLNKRSTRIRHALSLTKRAVASGADILQGRV